MLRRKDDVGISITDNIGAETTMSPDIIEGASAVRNPDLGMTITIKMQIVRLGGNLRSNMRTTVWSTPSHDLHKQGA